jgi:hypothetical protein
MAIDDLYERIKDQNYNRVVMSGNQEEAQESTDPSTKHDLKSWVDKLHAIQFRIIDLQDISVQWDSKKGKNK